MYTDKTLQQTGILDAEAKTEASWLFDITDTDSGAHYWSNKTKTWNGQSYTHKITGFKGIEFGGSGAESGIITPSKTSFQLIDKGNALDVTKYEGADIIIRAPMKANLGSLLAPGDTWDDLDSWDEQEAEMAAWGFEVSRAIRINQVITLHCRCWLDKYLQGDYPNTPLVQDLWPSSDTNAKKDNVCIPKLWGTAFIPVRSAKYATDGIRYYVLGPDTPTYVIDKIKAPKERGISTYSNDDYDLDNSGSFYTITGSDGNDYKVTKFIFVDDDHDGTADSNGFFKDGSKFLDVPCKYSRSDTLSLTNPAYMIENVLEDFGVPSAKIDDTSVAAAAATFTAWGLTFNGGLWYKRDRKAFLSELLLQCHMRLIVRDKIYFKVLS
ncbi:MAG TPA: hypothetical protein VMV77_15115, partial [Bacteroidales bacterium]|nr:hypothetical protein [Bacteroidales bacterium]